MGRRPLGKECLRVGTLLLGGRKLPIRFSKGEAHGVKKMEEENTN